MPRPIPPTAATPRRTPLERAAAARPTTPRGRRRPRRDRGAAATWVAVLMVPLLVVAALGIDVGAMVVDRQRLQHGADAAAYAIATDCARTGICTYPTALATARAQAAGNSPLGGAPTITVTDIDQRAGYVEVQNGSSRDHWFAPIIGIDDADLAVTSAATWGYPNRGPAVLPVSVSWCELSTIASVQTIRDTVGIVGLKLPAAGVVDTISVGVNVCAGPLLSTLTPILDPLLGPILNPVLPGGFSWLLQGGNGCGDTIVEVGAIVSTTSNNARPVECDPNRLRELVGQTVYLPVHVEVRTPLLDPILGTIIGPGGVRVVAFVAFTLQSYYLGSSQVASPGATGAMCEGALLVPVSQRQCIRGRFELALSIGAPNGGGFELGTDGAIIGDPTIQLVLPEEARP